MGTAAAAASPDYDDQIDSSDNAAAVAAADLKKWTSHAGDLGNQMLL